MFKQLLQVNLKQPHDKQKYALKRNQFVLREEAQVIKFDSILYSSEDIMSKTVFEILNVVSKNKNAEKSSVTVTFNYDIKAHDLILFFSKIMEVKPFHSFELAHFQIKHGHISDYCRKFDRGVNVVIDDLDQFQKEISSILKLERVWKINEYLGFKSLTAVDLNQELISKRVKFGKRTNEFFILDINKNIRIILILLPRFRQIGFTKEEEKQIEQLYILKKHAKKLQRGNICFSTYVAQIINNYLQAAQLNFFVSCYPQRDKPLKQVFKLPLRLSDLCEQEIRSIQQAYNRDKWPQLEQQCEKARKRLKQTRYLVKSEEENMQRLIKIFTKTFNSTFPSIEYLKKKGVTNINQHLNWLKNQIKLKQQKIQAQQNALKQIQKQIIIEERQHLFYASKIQQYKVNVQNNQKQRRATITPPSIKIKSDSIAGKDNELTQQELFFLYDPVKEATKYRQKKEEQMKKRLNTSPQKKQFLTMLQQAKQRLGFDEFNTFQEEYYGLISNE